MRLNVDFAGVMDRLEQLERENHQLRSIVLALADNSPVVSDRDGFDYCAICKSSDWYGAALQHEDDCPYPLALQVRKSERTGGDNG